MLLHRNSLQCKTLYERRTQSFFDIKMLLFNNKGLINEVVKFSANIYGNSL